MKVVSLNVDPLAEGADRNVRLAALARELEALDADILALHGVHGDGLHLNMGRELQGRLPAFGHLVVERAERAPDSPRWRGVALLSKVPIPRHGRMPLTAGGEQHTLLWAQFDVDDRPFFVFNTQFASDPARAKREVQQVVPFLGVCHSPGLLVATFNADTCQEAEQYLVRHGWRNPLVPVDSAEGCDGDEHLWANGYFEDPVRAEPVLAGDAPTAGPGFLATF